MGLVLGSELPLVLYSYPILRWQVDIALQCSCRCPTRVALITNPVPPLYSESL